MLVKPKNYEEIEVNNYDYEPVRLGGHIGIIKEASEYASKNYTSSLKICTDIAEGEQKDYFQKQYDNNKLSERKWSNQATKYVSLKEDENCVRMLKAFITSVENSNNGYKYDWNKEVGQLVGKKVGLVFGWEEYEKQDGTIGVATKLVQFRSIDKVKDAKIPKVKLIDGTYVEYEEFSNNKEDKKKSSNKEETNDEMYLF